MSDQIKTLPEQLKDLIGVWQDRLEICYDWTPDDVLNSCINELHDIVYSQDNPHKTTCFQRLQDILSDKGMNFSLGLDMTGGMYISFRVFEHVALSLPPPNEEYLAKFYTLSSIFKVYSHQEYLLEWAYGIVNLEAITTSDSRADIEHWNSVYDDFFAEYEKENPEEAKNIKHEVDLKLADFNMKNRLSEELAEHLRQPELLRVKY